ARAAAQPGEPGAADRSPRRVLGPAPLPKGAARQDSAAAAGALARDDQDGARPGEGAEQARAGKSGGLVPALEKPASAAHLELPPRRATVAADTDVLVVGGGPA